tara:strand:- start:2821 stop:3939 length:1119 start_codon:yes stop_codon:yes gene_type:complete
MKYLFHLGRDPKLSILEIVSYLKRSNKKYKLLKLTRKIALLEISSFQPKKELKFLGGTIKISTELKELEKTLKNEIDQIATNKILYGINMLESSENNKLQLTETIKKLSKEVKLKCIQKQVSEKEIAPSKAVKLDLELTLFKNKIYITQAVFNPKEYKSRDQSRPNFDPLKVTSLRLAKILINLAQPKKGDTLLDPFAGLGTIMQEAILMEIKTIGADKEIEMVKKCKKNLSWLKKTFNTKSSSKVIRSNIFNLSSKINKVDCIVTEPYLGPYLKKLPVEKEAREIAKKISKIYENLLNQASTLLNQGSKAVIIVPSFKTRNNKIIRIGFETLARASKFKIYFPIEQIKIPLEYNLEGGKINRKIYILEKLK